MKSETILQKNKSRGPSLSFETSLWTPLRDRLGPAQVANGICGFQRVEGSSQNRDFPRYQCLIFEIPHPSYSHISWKHRNRKSEILSFTYRKRLLEWHCYERRQGGTTSSSFLLKGLKPWDKIYIYINFNINSIITHHHSTLGGSHLELPFWQ